MLYSTEPHLYIKYSDLQSQNWKVQKTNLSNQIQSKSG